MGDLRRRCAFVLGVAALLAGCGGGGGGGGTPAPLPVVDVAVRGTVGSTMNIHLYRDALAGGTVHAPDVRISPPASIEFMGFTGTHLVLGADFGVANQNRIWVYTPADLAEVNPTPSVQCLLPPPAGATGVAIRGFVVHGADVYVYSSYNDGMLPATLQWITHVFRDVTTLPNAAPPDATILHHTVTTSGISVANDSLAVDDSVLLATSRGNVYVNQAPDALSGNEVPDLTLGLVADLGLSGSSHVEVGGGEAYLYRNGFGVAAFADGAGLSAGDVPRFILEGPSLVAPGPGCLLRLGSRLFVRGPFNTLPISIVGFDVGGAVANSAPPDVALGVPVTGDQRLAGAADALFAASTTTGVVAGYARASLLVDGDQPSVYLYDPEIVEALEVRVVAR